MPQTIIPTGVGLGTVLAAAIEIPGGQFDPVTMLVSAGACGVIAWVLLQATLVRGKDDAKARDKQEDQLLVLTREQIAAQTAVSAKLDSLTVSIRESVSAQNETTQMTRRLIDTMQSRPCIAQKDRSE